MIKGHKITTVRKKMNRDHFPFLSSCLCNTCVWVIIHGLRGSGRSGQRRAARLEQLKGSACSQERRFYQWGAWDIKNLKEFKTSSDILPRRRFTGTAQAQTEVQRPAQEGRFSDQKQHHAALAPPSPSLPGSGYRPQPEMLMLILHRRGKSGLH